MSAGRSSESSALDAWLEPRLEVAPPGLAGAVRELLDGGGGGPGPDARDGIPVRLADAALRGFEAVLAEPTEDRRSRVAALRLLAADAALTYAFEAAADLGLETNELADRLGPRGALGAGLARGKPS